jgi:iron-sulfur cluster assembly protein
MKDMIREDTDIQTAPSEMIGASPIMVSASAAAKLEEVMSQKGMADHMLRVFVSGGGCSGFQYGMAFENTVEEGDLVFEAAQGPNVVVDPVSIQYLGGASIDFVDTLMGGGFKIENPNATTTCGCGSSFNTAGDQPEGAAQGGGCGSGCG